MSVNLKTLKNSSILIVFTILVILTVRYVFTAPVSSPDNLDPTLIDRIKPIGQVLVEGTTKDATFITNNTLSETDTEAKSRTGEQVASSSCTGCHSSGVLGAPIAGNKTDWEPRLERGITELLKTAKLGKGAMPPKGTCATCSDAELQAAIEFMIN
jgi:cytochrome c5